MTLKTTAIAVAIALASVLPGMLHADCHEKKTPAEMEKKLDKFSNELKLNADQKNKVRTIKQGKHEKVEAAHKDAQNEIRGLLTPEQQVKYDKMIADRD